MSEPHMRYVVEKRRVKAPPAPMKNDWELTASYDELQYAQEAARDDAEDMPAWKFRVRDTRRYCIEKRRVGETGDWSVHTHVSTLKWCLPSLLNSDGYLEDYTLRVIDTRTEEDVTRQAETPIRDRDAVMARFTDPFDNAIAADQRALRSRQPMPAYDHGKTVREVRSSLSDYELSLIDKGVLKTCLPEAN